MGFLMFKHFFFNYLTIDCSKNMRFETKKKKNQKKMKMRTLKKTKVLKKTFF